ncbi:PREDICTED: uncharacterized protein LOC109211213 [Nicotiana attenuata]|uniref:uncharacterized protein LOC109211213 n=1 Tax=Nicotiana attenuata TaxID=49451 RepID=UPI00090524BB|nr:PREDICTED: uncharacterized protein LOC109211213 [Nicotiana attenuata]
MRNDLYFILKLRYTAKQEQNVYLEIEIQQGKGEISSSGELNHSFKQQMTATTISAWNPAMKNQFEELGLDMRDDIRSFGKRRGRRLKGVNLGVIGASLPAEAISGRRLRAESGGDGKGHYRYEEDEVISRTKEFIVHLRKQKVYQFLMGLNDSYSEARSQILMTKPLPSVNQAYAMLMSDKSQIAVAVAADNADSEQFTSSAQANVAVTPSKSRTVLLPNGDVTLVTQTGDSNISVRSTFKDVFYVPQFKFNLLSVSKVTRDLKCFASVYPDLCVFRDLFSGRVREIGRESDGLYFLQKYGGKMLTAISLAAAGIKSRQGDTTVDVALWHKRLGHVSSIVVRKLFASKLASINETVNKCTLYHIVSEVWHHSSKNMCLYSSANGVAETKHMHILEVTRALRFQANIPIKYWGHYVLAAVYLIDRMPSSVLHGLSPFELLYGRAPNLGHIRILGCLCYAKQVRETDKLLPRAKDISFMEDIFPFKNISDTSPPIFLPPELSSFSKEQPSLPPVPARHESTASSPLHQPAADVMPSILPPPSQHSTGLRRSLRTSQAPIGMKDFVSQPRHKSIPYSIINYVSYDRLSPKYQAYLIAFSAIQEPASFE